LPEGFTLAACVSRSLIPPMWIFFLGKFDDKVKIKSMIFCGKQPVIRKDDEM